MISFAAFVTHFILRGLSFSYACCEQKCLNSKKRRISLFFYFLDPRMSLSLSVAMFFFLLIDCKISKSTNESEPINRIFCAEYMEAPGVGWRCMARIVLQKGVNLL